MQETWKFLNLQAPEKEEIKFTQWLNDVFNHQRKELGFFLSYYYRKEGAVVENVRLIRPADDLTGRTGSISVSFELVYFNACLNIHESNPEDMILTYEISPCGTELTFTGPYWPEREADEI